MDDGHPWVVGFHFRTTTGWAGATSRERRDGLVLKLLP